MPYKDPQKQKEAQRKWYLDKQQATVAERSRKTRLVRWEWLNELKQGVPCVDCKGIFHPCCMDYHHKDGAVKEFNISEGMTKVGKVRLLAEIAKCELICSNCHRVRHFYRA